MEKKNNIATILGQVRNPLVFFTLALLLIEGIIGFVVTKTSMSETQTFCSVIIMAFLFLVVVVAVTLITIKWPRHLYEDIAKEIEVTHVLKEYIESSAFIDTIEDIMYKRIKKECFEKNSLE